MRVGPIDGQITLPVATSKFAMNDKVPWRMYSNSTRSTRPGRTRFVSWRRSSACIPVFSSVLTTCVPTAASSGAPRYVSQVRLAKKRSTCLGEMLSTIPLFIASRVSSGGVQCETGSPLSEGGSQANAMIDATSSGVNFGGAPHRSLSSRTPRFSFSRSLPFAPSFSASTRAALAPVQRTRHRRTRCGATFARVSGSSTALCFAVTSTVTDLLPMRSPSLEIATP